MSEIVIAGNTSGSVTIAAPDVAGTTTLTLPASSGTVLDDASVGVCRAWVNFNGTGTVAIRQAFNVSSVTDNGTGNYTVNFTTAMADANYAAVFGGQGGTGGTLGYLTGAGNNASMVQTTTTIQVLGANGANGFVDLAVANLAIFR